jgi:hypothetical protein
MPTTARFEVYEGYSDGRLTGRFKWRFIDGHGTRTGMSGREFDSRDEAKQGAADFVLAMRAVTYGKRFDDQIAAIVVDAA